MLRTVARTQSAQGYGGGMMALFPAGGVLEGFRRLRRLRKGLAAADAASGGRLVKGGGGGREVAAAAAVSWFWKEARVRVKKSLSSTSF